VAFDIFCLGISFHTSSISYVVDVYRGEQAAIGIHRLRAVYRFFPQCCRHRPCARFFVDLGIGSTGERRAMSGRCILLGYEKMRWRISSRSSTDRTQKSQQSGMLNAWTAHRVRNADLLDFSGYSDIWRSEWQLFGFHFPETSEGRISLQRDRFWRTSGTCRFHVGADYYPSAGGNRAVR